MAALYCIPFISPGPKDALRHVCLKLAQWFLRWRILNVVIAISLFCHGLAPLGETVWHFIWANWTSKWFVLSLVEIALVVLHGKNMKNIKTDNWQQPINKLILSACELKRISSSKKWVLTHFLGKFLTMRLNFFSNGKIYFGPIVPGGWVRPSFMLYYVH